MVETFNKKLFDLHKSGQSYPNESTKWLLEKLNKPDNFFVKTDLSKITVGKFYFMRYDANRINKSSKLEQIVPLFVVDYKPSIDKKVLWILNFNFLPLNLKEAFVSSFLSEYESIIGKNSTQMNWSKEVALPNRDYQVVWSGLIKYGFEYSIREIRLDLIHDIYGVSMRDIHYLITQNTQTLTGVDEAKLTDIWVAKLKKENLTDRIIEFKTIKTNYENIILDLAKKFKALNNHISQIK